MFAHLQRVMLLTAWAFLFAHSVVPHAHEATPELEVCATEHIHEANLLEALSHIFHFSTGVDHLEDFSTASATLVAIVAAQVQLVPPPSIVVIHSSVQPTVQFSEEHCRYRPLRAPPVYS